MIRKTPLLLSVLAAAVPAFAQQQPRVVQALLWNPSTSTTRVAHQFDHCSTPARTCDSPLPLSGGWSGGLALAPTRDTLWYTTGVHLVEKLRNCATPCTFAGVRSLGTGSVIGGLAVSATHDELYQIESIAGQAAITTYDTTVPCLAVKSTTPLPLPTILHRTGAIAYDGRQDYLYVSASIFVPQAPSNRLYVLKRSRPGWAVHCVTTFDECNGGLGPVQGMTYDECRGIMWVADEARLYEQDLTYRTGCPTLTSLSCCTGVRTEQYHGIDIELGRVTEVGSSCAPRNCGSCPSMRLSAGGQPIVGNSQFELRLTGGPAGQAAFLVLAAGPCSTFPFACGTLYPSLASRWVALPFGNLAGPSACEGSATLTLPVPPEYGLCGRSMCVQALVACPSAFGLTNGVVFTFEG